MNGHCFMKTDTDKLMVGKQIDVLFQQLIQSEYKLRSLHFNIILYVPVCVSVVMGKLFW